MKPHNKQYLLTLLAESYAEGKVYATKEMPPMVREVLAHVGFNRPTVTVYPMTSVTAGDGGGGGEKEFFVSFDINDGSILKELTGSWGGAGLASTGNQVDMDRRSHPIPEGVGVVKGSYGGGSPVRAYLCIHPNNLTKMVGDGSEDVPLTSDEKKILLAASYVGIYKMKEMGEIDTDYIDDSDRKKPVLTKKGLAAIQALRERGYIKDGSFTLTVKGQNSAPRY